MFLTVLSAIISCKSAFFSVFLFQELMMTEMTHPQPLYVGVVVQCINHSPVTQEARRSFPGGDNATPQTAKQTADKGCTIVHLKWCLQVDIPEAQKPRAKTIGSPHNLPHQW